MSNDHGSEIVHRHLATDRENPAVEVAEAVADIKGVDEAELTPTWTCIDDILDNLFSDPPAPEAQAQITFTYEGFRVTVEQDGSAKFVEVD